MIVTVNDETVEVDDQITVAGLLERLGFPEKGILWSPWTGRCCRGRAGRPR